MRKRSAPVKSPLGSIAFAAVPTPTPATLLAMVAIDSPAPLASSTQPSPLGVKKSSALSIKSHIPSSQVAFSK